MSELAPLSSRAVEILNSIVHTYVQTGRPVASRSISKMRQHSLSAASVRNVMVDLVEEGYLSQPHTSAGRVPTQKAFRLFVQSLTAKRAIEELADLRGKLADVDTVSGRVEMSSHILVELTKGLGIAAAIPTAGQVLDQVELVALADGRILMIVVTRDKMVHNRVVSLREPVTRDELASIRNYINQNYGGCVLSEVRGRLKARLDEASAAYDSILKKLSLLYAGGLLDIGTAPEIYMEGAANLVGIDLHLTQEKLRELFRTLEEKKRILALLEQFLDGAEGEVLVRVGLGEAHPSMKELSLIGLSVALPAGLGARIAVIGPMRMNYQRAMSAVLHVGQAFQSVPV
ncbi:MAG: heat-inducible transcription repressor HrcA [bacterium]|nr:heat-inducible transcription repressor HrcA [bacterium]